MRNAAHIPALLQTHSQSLKFNRWQQLKRRKLALRSVEMRLKRFNMVSASRYRSLTEVAIQPRVHILTRTRAAFVQFQDQYHMELFRFCEDLHGSVVIRLPGRVSKAGFFSEATKVTNKYRSTARFHSSISPSYSSITIIAVCGLT